MMVVVVVVVIIIVVVVVVVVVVVGGSRNPALPPSSRAGRGGLDGQLRPRIGKGLGFRDLVALGV